MSTTATETASAAGGSVPVFRALAPAQKLSLTNLSSMENLWLYSLGVVFLLLASLNSTALTSSHLQWAQIPWATFVSLLASIKWDNFVRKLATTSHPPVDSGKHIHTHIRFSTLCSYVRTFYRLRWSMHTRWLLQPTERRRQNGSCIKAESAFMASGSRPPRNFLQLPAPSWPPPQQQQQHDEFRPSGCSGLAGRLLCMTSIYRLNRLNCGPWRSGEQTHDLWVHMPACLPRTGL